MKKLTNSNSAITAVILISIAAYMTLIGLSFLVCLFIRNCLQDWAQGENLRQLSCYASFLIFFSAVTLVVSFIRSRINTIIFLLLSYLLSFALIFLGLLGLLSFYQALNPELFSWVNIIIGAGGFLLSSILFFGRSQSLLESSRYCRQPRKKRGENSQDPWENQSGRSGYWHNEAFTIRAPLENPDLFLTGIG